MSTRVGAILKKDESKKPQLEFSVQGDKLVVLVTTGFVKQFKNDKEIGLAKEMIKRNQNDTVAYLKDTGFKEY